MKKLIKLTIPLALAFLVSACGDKAENQAADHNHEEMAQHESSQKEISSQTKLFVHLVYENKAICFFNGG